VQHKLIHARALSISAYKPFFGNSYIQRSEPLLLLHLLRKDEQTSHCWTKEGRKEARSAISEENCARPKELFPSSPPPPPKNKKQIPNQNTLPGWGSPSLLARGAERWSHAATGSARSLLPPTRARTLAKWDESKCRPDSSATWSKAGSKKGEPVYSLSWVQSVSWAARSWTVSWKREKRERVSKRCWPGAAQTRGSRPRGWVLGWAGLDPGEQHPFLRSVLPLREPASLLRPAPPSPGAARPFPHPPTQSNKCKRRSRPSLAKQTAEEHAMFKNKPEREGGGGE